MFTNRLYVLLIFIYRLLIRFYLLLQDAFVYYEQGKTNQQTTSLESINRTSPPKHPILFLSPSRNITRYWADAIFHPSGSNNIREIEWKPLRYQPIQRYVSTRGSRSKERTY